MNENIYIESRDGLFFKATLVDYYNVDFKSERAVINCFSSELGKFELALFYCKSESLARVTVSAFMHIYMNWLKEEVYISSNKIVHELYKIKKNHETLGE